MRMDNWSSLDFTYWILENVEENYQSVGSDAIYTSGTDVTGIMHTTVVDCALICGVEVPRAFDALLAKVNRYGTAIDPETAMGTRGAILYRAGALAVSVGDERRLVSTDVDNAISIYQMTSTDREPSYWDGAFLIPELRYL